jgi:hypothetical protein
MSHDFESAARKPLLWQITKEVWVNLNRDFRCTGGFVVAQNQMIATSQNLGSISKHLPTRPGIIGRLGGE